MDNLTETDGNRSIDPERYNKDNPQICQKCGSELRGAGDASTVGCYCPECEVSVWIA